MTLVASHAWLTSGRKATPFWSTKGLTILYEVNDTTDAHSITSRDFGRSSVVGRE